MVALLLLILCLALAPLIGTPWLEQVKSLLLLDMVLVLVLPEAEVS